MKDKKTRNEEENINGISDIPEDTKFYHNSSLTDSFNNAINGLVDSVSLEKNMRIHMLAGIAVIILCLFLDFTKIEMALLTISIILVLVAEIFNTAIEAVTDLATRGKYHILAKKAKDVSAGAVFLTAVNALFVGYLLITPKLSLLWTGKKVINKIISNPTHLAFIAIAFVLISVLFLKGIFYRAKGTHFQGGSVSGHSAISFAIATIGAIMSQDIGISLLFYILAAIVAESRVETKIHSITEVVIGGMLGTVVAGVLFYQFL
ncbi:diacylglycerol kinase [Peptoniphilaceae bacterium SGI.131]